MSDQIKHECGIALIRFRKPLSYFVDKYKDPKYGIKKLYLLMQKQHNRGQDGAGIATLKIHAQPGEQYIHRYRSIDNQPIEDIFRKVEKKIEKERSENPQLFFDEEWLNNKVPYIGDVYLGHLRYGTHGKNQIEFCHPMHRKNNWRTRTLVMAGNFNMTNVDALFKKLVELGQHPKEKTDTVTVMEKIGHFLDEEVQAKFEKYHSEGYENIEISEKISQTLDMQRVLKRSCKDFDGGYAMIGFTGSGTAFVARDPAGIRPAYYYADDEIVVIASEKPAIKTAFNVDYNQIKEVRPAHALIIHKDGTFAEYPFAEPLPKRSCSFERIYFSRGTDPEIYNERKALGELLVPLILEKINYDLENAVFSYIPNTAETSFLGMMKGLENYLIKQRVKAIEEGRLKGEALEKLLSFRPRVEKLVIKDAKLRTFITDDGNRDDLVAHVYDTTYEVIQKHKDTLVVIDDSIVRGTTLEKSIISMLDKLSPKKIVIVSSAPQIRYPDCYGIDMSRMGDFIAFRAMLNLLKADGKQHLIEETYQKCKKALELPQNEAMINHVQTLYQNYSDGAISAEIARMVRPKNIQAEIEIVFQTVDNLHKASPNHTGDWYFTGNYPTLGGVRVVNQAFVNYMEGKKGRAY
ncbi:MAG: amidophosphoribosyltransferase [Flammeovirgaceae bacterium]